MASIVAVGSLAFDSIETPFGRQAKVLGGSVNHFSISASFFAPVWLVSVVGEDFPKEHLRLLQGRGIDTDGIKISTGRTFHWSGRYGDDLNEAHTLDTQLNVFEAFEPDLPAKYRQAEYVFLGNIAPTLQMKVLDQVSAPRFVALDTMNYWIESQKEALIKAIARCHCLVINEYEVRQLTGMRNVVQAAKVIQRWGPKMLVIKRGEYGTLAFSGSSVFGLPAMPLETVKDPTGAGDAFAGGLMGYLASNAADSVSDSPFRQAAVYGSVMASFIVQDFGFQQLLNVDQRKIKERYQQFVDLTRFEPAPRGA